MNIITSQYIPELGLESGSYHTYYCKCSFYQVRLDIILYINYIVVHQYLNRVCWDRLGVIIIIRITVYYKSALFTKLGLSFAYTNI